MGTGHHFRVVLFLVSLLFSLGVYSQQCPSSCTYTISQDDYGAYTLNVGQQMCISAAGKFYGSVVINGGTICNDGLLQPLSITVKSGTINNYGMFKYVNSFGIYEASLINNYGGIELGENIIVDTTSQYFSFNKNAYFITQLPGIVQPKLKLAALYCGASLSISSKIITNYDNAYNYYRCEFSTNATFSNYNPSDLTMTVEYQKGNAPLFSNLSGLQMSQTYYCRVLGKQNLNDSWGLPGDVCSITFTGVSAPVFAQAYYNLDRKLSGAYYQLATDKKLRFKYNNEYAITNNSLSYAIYNTNHKAFQGLPALSKIVGENLYTIDLGAVSGFSSGQLYILEVISDKNEKFYLKFKYL